MINFWKFSDQNKVKSKAQRKAQTYKVVLHSVRFILCCLLFLGSVALPAQTPSSRTPKAFSACQKYFVIPDFLNSLTRVQETALQSLAHIYVGILTGEPASSNLEQLKIQLNESLMQWSEILRQEGHPQSSTFVRDAFLYKVRELLEVKDSSLFVQSAQMVVERKSQLLHMKKTHTDKVQEERLQEILNKYEVSDLNQAFGKRGGDIQGSVDLQAFKDLEFLLEMGADVNFAGKDQTDATVLMRAVASGNIAIIQLLLKWNANLEQQHLLGTALGWAKTSEVAELLLAAGAALEATDLQGNTPLLHSLQHQKNDSAVVWTLIEKGANIFQMNQSGRTVLMSASAAGLTGVVEFLVSKGLHVNAVDAKGFTALMYAVEASELPIVKFLLESGADANIVNKQKQIAFAIARKKADPAGTLPVSFLIKYSLRNPVDVQILNALKPLTKFNFRYRFQHAFNTFLVVPLVQARDIVLWAGRLVKIGLLEIKTSALYNRLLKSKSVTKQQSGNTRE